MAGYVVSMFDSILLKQVELVVIFEILIENIQTGTNFRTFMTSEVELNWNLMIMLLHSFNTIFILYR